jgi:hypothetical protein
MSSFLLLEFAEYVFVLFATDYSTLFVTCTMQRSWPVIWKAICSKPDKKVASYTLNFLGPSKWVSRSVF